MADLPSFQFTTQEDWYWEIPFLNADAAGAPLALVDAQGRPRVFEVPITPAQSGASLVDPVVTLTMAAATGARISFKDTSYTTLVFRLPKTVANTFGRGDFTADILEVVDSERHLFMPVRISYQEPSAIRSFISRLLGVAVSFSARLQPIVTPIAIAGRQGLPGATILAGVVPPVPADGKDGDYFIEDRTGSNQGRRMYGPKAAGAWPGPPWTIQVAGISDVPGLVDSLAARLRVDAAQNLNTTQKSQARSNLGLGEVATMSTSEVIAAVRNALNGQEF